VKFGTKVWTWDSLPRANLVKKSLKGMYPFWADLYQILAILAILGAVNPHFKSDISEIWHEGAGLGLPPHGIG